MPRKKVEKVIKKIVKKVKPVEEKINDLEEEYTYDENNPYGKQMPKALEEKLKKRAKKMGLSKKRQGAYIYGTLRKTGWKPSTQK